MKSNVVARISNVINAENCISYLKNRPRTEMVGLGLIFGPPGLGKTRFCFRRSCTEGYLYIRLQATSTAKTFANTLLKAINYKLNTTSTVRGSANKIMKECIETLKPLVNIIIVIDEIDYAFKKKELLGSIRDIVDETLAIVILVGMKDARKELLKANAHYFDRCNFFTEFTPLNLQDIKLICNEIADVKMADDLITMLSKNTRGNIRKLIKNIHTIESQAKLKNLDKVSFRDIDWE